MEQDRLTLLGPEKLDIMLRRLCMQLIENHPDFTNSAMVAIQPRGVYLGRRMHGLLQELGYALPYGELDVTFFRDDFRRHVNPLLANTTRIDFVIEGKRIILVDDVLFTGRTIRAALDAMLAFGRPDQVELLVLVDRLGKRELPIEPEYSGIRVDTLNTEKVIVRLRESGGEDFIRIESAKPAHGV